jgi:hypothetical protein
MAPSASRAEAGTGGAVRVSLSMLLLGALFRDKPRSPRHSGPPLFRTNRRGAKIPRSYSGPVGRRDELGDVEPEHYVLHLQWR